MIDGIGGKCAPWKQWRMSKARRTSLAATLMALSVAASAPTPARAHDHARSKERFRSCTPTRRLSTTVSAVAGDDNVLHSSAGSGECSGPGCAVPHRQEVFYLLGRDLCGHLYDVGCKRRRPSAAPMRESRGRTMKMDLARFRARADDTGGPERFRGTRGRLAFEAVAGPDSLGAVAGRLNGMAFYLVRGTVDTGE